MTYEEKLDELTSSALHNLFNKIAESGKESQFSSNPALPITDDDLMFNLEGGRYLAEVAIINGSVTLIDNSGYQYSVYSMEETENLFKVIDHLL